MVTDFQSIASQSATSQDHITEAVSTLFSDLGPAIVDYAVAVSTLESLHPTQFDLLVLSSLLRQPRGPDTPCKHDLGGRSRGKHRFREISRKSVTNSTVLWKAPYKHVITI